MSVTATVRITVLITVTITVTVFQTVFQISLQLTIFAHQDQVEKWFDVTKCDQVVPLFCGSFVAVA